jgi:hypothetical protein
MGFGVRVIHTPAGACPVKLTGTEYEVVEKWANNVMEQGIINHLNYLPSALIFFAQQFYRVFGPEHNLVKQHIENIFSVSKSAVETLEAEIKEIKENIETEKNKESTEENKPKKRGRPKKAK